MGNCAEHTGTVLPQLLGNEKSRLDNRAVGVYIHGLLNGTSSNGTSPEAFGKFLDVIEVLHHADAAGRSSSVHVAWNGIVRRRPELAALVSGDQPSGPNHDTGAPVCPEVLWRRRFATVADALGKRSWEIWAGTFA